MLEGSLATVTIPRWVLAVGAGALLGSLLAIARLRDRHPLERRFNPRESLTTTRQDGTKGATHE